VHYNDSSGQATGKRFPSPIRARNLGASNRCD
jgi:hypothetical protein